ncbi:MAG: hypothetical protein QGG02_14550 [Gammaproteobacteria bacterium]|nr:hypothetical protein [Gammaproteobacteria bacterium]MDP6733278.1 hypothetical protein [Gammaproteobacteria bacterium]
MNCAKFFRSITSTASAASFMLFSFNAFSQNTDTVGFDRTGSTQHSEIEEVANGDEMPGTAESLLEFLEALAIQKSALEGDTNDVSLDRPLILGDRTLRSIIYKMELVEAAAFGLFNELNTGDTFDLNCERETGEDTLVARQLCKPVFLARFISETVSEERAMRQSRDLYDQLNEEITKVAEDNEELSVALVYRNTLQKELDGLFEAELDEVDFLTAVRFGLIPDAVYYEEYINRGFRNTDNGGFGSSVYGSGPYDSGPRPVFSGGAGDTGGGAAAPAAGP